MRLLVEHHAIRRYFQDCRVSEANEHWIRNTVEGVSISNSFEIHDTHFLCAGAACTKWESIKNKVGVRLLNAGVEISIGIKGYL